MMLERGMPQDLSTGALEELARITQRLLKAALPGSPIPRRRGDGSVFCAPPVEGKLIHGFEGADVGHRVRALLVHTDVDRGYISTRLAW